MEPQEKILAFSNRFHEFGTQTIEGADCVISPFPYIDPEQNKITLELTGEQITELVSSIQIGAEWAYPDKSHQILFNFLKGMICAPTLDPQGDCTEYPPSAAFIKYFPDNPFVSGDTADGWYFEAWHRWFQFDTFFPDFVDDWLNGSLNGLTQYQDTDVMFNISSLLAPNIIAFLNGGGVLPKIEIRFSGTGHINLTLLSFPLGGKAIVELDQEPNVLDILTGGVIDPAAFMVELNRDVLSFPPDEYPIIQLPIDITTGGDHVLYINFIPTLDDAAVPLLFGGGLRSVEMCGFLEAPAMGIEQLIWDGCQLSTLTGGIETVVVTAEQIQACLDLPSGGGGGGAASIKALARYITLGANLSFTETTWTEKSDTDIAWIPTKSHALIGVSASVSNAGSQSSFIRPVVRQGANLFLGTEDNQGRTFGTTIREVWCWEVFDSYALTNSTIRFQTKVSGSTGALSANFDLQYVILEFEDASELFVEDIRINAGELQKKIGGVWINVTDSFQSIIANLQTQVSSALTQAATALTAANNAQTTANSAVTINNNQNVRLNALESDVEDLELDAAAQAITLNDHESRIDTLEAASGGTAIWNTYSKDLRLSAGNWAVSNGSWISGQGFVASFDGSPITISQTIEWVSQRYSYFMADFRILDGNSAEMMVEFLGLTTDSQPIVKADNADITLARVYVRIPTITSPLQQVAIRFSPLSNDGKIRIENIKFIGLSTMFADGD